mmetsp:Transcript_7884/g.20357  ORF Transcript_7884/g.20357 Transcript_7884/m.20357 type:complete len:307 (+) Transcript_7884:183-1103(+)
MRDLASMQSRAAVEVRQASQPSRLRSAAMRLHAVTSLPASESRHRLPPRCAPPLPATAWAARRARPPLPHCGRCAASSAWDRGCRSPPRRRPHRQSASGPTEVWACCAHQACRRTRGASPLSLLGAPPGPRHPAGRKPSWMARRVARWPWTKSRARRPHLRHGCGCVGHRKASRSYQSHACPHYPCPPGAARATRASAAAAWRHAPGTGTDTPPPPTRRRGSAAGAAAASAAAGSAASAMRASSRRHPSWRTPDSTSGDAPHDCGSCRAGIGAASHGPCRHRRGPRTDRWPRACQSRRYHRRRSRP